MRFAFFYNLFWRSEDGSPRKERVEKLRSWEEEVRSCEKLVWLKGTER